jgi:hypothetical protein
MVLNFGSSIALFLPIAGFHLYNLNRLNLDALHGIAHLPIKRNGLAPLVVLSPLLAGLLGIAAVGLTGIGNRTGYPFGVQMDSERLNVDGEEEFYSEINVPKTMWKLHIGFDQPEPVLVELESGSQESFTPVAYRTISFLPFGTYNPYEVGPDSSIGFFASQLDRAVEDGYGLKLGTDVVLSELIGVDDLG